MKNLLIVVLLAWFQSGWVNCLEAQEFDSLLNSDDDSMKVVALADLVIHFANSDPGKADYFLNEAFKSARVLEDTFCLAHCFRREGNLFYLKGDYENAETSYDKALAICRAYKNEQLESRVLDNIGTLKQRQSKFEEAADYMHQALEKAEKVGFGIGGTLNNLANIYTLSGDYERAIPYYSRALAMSLEGASKGNVHAPRMIGHAALNIGECFLKLNILDSAIYYTLYAKENYEKLQDQRGAAKALANLSVIRRLEGDYAQAIHLGLESLQLAKALEGLGENEDLLFSLAESYFGLGDYRNAMTYFDQCLQVARKSQNLYFEMKSHERIAHVFEANGDLLSSYDHYKKFTVLKDSIFNIEKNGQIERLNARYENERKERQIELLSSENKVRELQLDRSITIRNYIIGISALILIFAFFVYRNYRLKQKTNKDLSLLLEERETLLKEIHHRVKNNLQIISSLLKLQAGTLKDTSAVEAINEGQNRVRSMSLIHQQLYQSEDPGGVYLDEYLHDLTSELFDAFGIGDEDVECRIETNKLRLDIDTVIPLGLILNELITNSLKYAFVNKKQGLLEIRMNENDSKLEVEVADNGKGVTLEKLQNSNGFGWKIINSLSRKLKAEIDILNNEGTTVQLKLSRYKLVV